MKTPEEIKEVVESKYNEWKNRNFVLEEVERITEQLYQWAKAGCFNEFQIKGQECQIGGRIECKLGEENFFTVCRELALRGFEVHRNVDHGNPHIIWVQWVPSHKL